MTLKFVQVLLTEKGDPAVSVKSVILISLRIDFVKDLPACDVVFCVSFSFDTNKRHYFVNDYLVIFKVKRLTSCSSYMEQNI